MPDITIAERTITIEVQNELKLVGLIIEHNSFNRHMTFGVNDMAYTCDIDALNKKVDALAEVSHNNDTTLLQDYPTVDEVNEVLGNYVLKTDMPSQVDISTLYTKDEADNKFALKSDVPEPVDLSEYRKKDDISIKGTTLKTLACTRSTTTRFHYETDEFIDHAQIKGSLTIGNQTITFDFEFILSNVYVLKFSI